MDVVSRGLFNCPEKNGSIYSNGSGLSIVKI